MLTTLENGIERVSLTPVTWRDFPHADEVKPLNDNDYEVLNDIQKVLMKHNAIERFGINLIHRHFELNDGEIIFESTDEKNRVQFIDVRPASSIDDKETILETQWVFNGGKGLVCLKHCDYNSGHRHIHQFK